MSNEKKAKRETNESEQQKNEVKLLIKLIYAFSAGPSQMLLSAINVFSTIFLLEAAKLPPSKSSAFDAFTDPIYGYLIDRTKPIKFGRFKLWILISFPLTALSYLLLWYIPDFSETGKFFWFLIWNCVFFTVISGVRFPLISLNRNLTKSNKEREFITTLRMGFEIVGILAGIGIQSPFVSMNNTCKRLNETIIDIGNGNKTDQLQNENNQSFWDNKYFLVAIVLVSIFVISQIAMLYFVEEKLEKIDQNTNDKDVNVIKELKKVLSFKPFVILSISTFMNTLAVTVIQTNLQLYFEYGYTAIKKLFTFAVLGLLLCSILFVPLWQFLMIKLGKKLCIVIGCLTMLPLTIGFLFFKTDSIWEIIALFGLSVIGSSGLTVTILVPWAMLPECIDDYFLKFRSKSDTLFVSFFAIGPKILMAIYLGTSQAILSAVGYQNGICAEDQNENVGRAVTYLISFVPAAGFILSIILIYFYSIDEKQAKKNSDLIKNLNLMPSGYDKVNNFTEIAGELDNLGADFDNENKF